MARPHWIAVFAVILLSWCALYLMAAPAPAVPAGLPGRTTLQSLCAVTPGGAGLAGLALMWAVMSAAMMLPTALPALATYDDLGHAARTDFARLAAGYLAAWGGFSLAAAALQLWLHRAGLVDALGASRSAALSGALLVGAGAYQFSPLKDACLAKCRAPLTFFMQHWAEGPGRMGLRLGLACLGCCWALMLLGFAGGVMSLAFMGVAMVIMVLEKLPDPGRHLTRPLGAGLVAAGLWVLATRV